MTNTTTTPDALNNRQRRAGFSVDSNGHLMWFGWYAGAARRFDLTNASTNFQQRLIVQFWNLSDAPAHSL